MGEVGLEQRRILLSALLQIPGNTKRAVELMATDFGVPVPARNTISSTALLLGNLADDDLHLQSSLRRSDEFLDVCSKKWLWVGANRRQIQL